VAGAGGCSLGASDLTRRLRLKAQIASKMTKIQISN
jgi:hypothetical protein